MFRGSVLLTGLPLSKVSKTDDLALKLHKSKSRGSTDGRGRGLFVRTSVEVRYLHKFVYLHVCKNFVQRLCAVRTVQDFHCFELLFGTSSTMLTLSSLHWPSWGPTLHTFRYSDLAGLKLLAMSRARVNYQPPSTHFLSLESLSFPSGRQVHNHGARNLMSMYPNFLSFYITSHTRSNFTLVCKYSGVLLWAPSS
jgi:hypothetical protein